MTNVFVYKENIEKDYDTLSFVFINRKV